MLLFGSNMCVTPLCIAISKAFKTLPLRMNGNTASWLSQFCEHRIINVPLGYNMVSGWFLHTKSQWSVILDQSSSHNVEDSLIYSNSTFTAPIYHTVSCIQYLYFLQLILYFFYCWAVSQTVKRTMKVADLNIIRRTARFTAGCGE